MSFCRKSARSGSDKSREIRVRGISYRPPLEKGEPGGDSIFRSILPSLSFERLERVTQLNCSCRREDQACPEPADSPFALSRSKRERRIDYTTPFGVPITLDISRIQQPSLQEELHVTTTIHNQQNVDLPIQNSVNDTVRFEENLTVFANP